MTNWNKKEIKEKLENLGFEVTFQDPNQSILEYIRSNRIGFFDQIALIKENIKYNVLLFEMNNAESAIKNNYKIYYQLKNQYNFAEGNAVGKYLGYVAGEKKNISEVHSVLEILRTVG